MDEKILRRTIGLAMLSPEMSGESSFLEDLLEMVGYVDKLREVDTTDVEFDDIKKISVNDLRDDCVLQEEDPEGLTLAAPSLREGLFVVPKTFGKDAP